MNTSLSLEICVKGFISLDHYEVAKCLRNTITLNNLRNALVDMTQQTLKSVYFKKWFHRTTRPLYFKKEKAAAPTTEINQSGYLTEYNPWDEVMNRAD